MTATTGATSTTGSVSLLVRSMTSSRARTVSTIDSSASVIAGVITASPSRSRDSRVSPTWVSCSSRLKARKPLVPLIVWIVRKMLDSRSRESGCCSSSTRSRSS